VRARSGGTPAEIPIRRPRGGRGGRKAFASGRAKQNMIKTTAISGEHGAPLWCDAQRIPVEHAIAELKWWRPLRRYTGRRQLLPATA
jgi:hypothetical protein